MSGVPEAGTDPGQPVPPTTTGGGQAAAATGGTVPAGGLWSDAWRELRRNPLFIVSGLIILVFVTMAIAPQLFTSTSPYESVLTNSLQRPSSEAWFGYDLQGRDYYARTIYGARASITIGISVVLMALVIAVVLGSAAGYYGGLIDSILSRVTDIAFALPTVLGAIVLLSVLDNRGIPQVALALTLFSWTVMTRLMRSAVIAAKSSDYVAAARVLGASDLRILRKHILPNAIAPVVVYATTFLGIIIAAEAALTFLGVGLQLPAISWGLAISEARGPRLLQTPHLLLFPGGFLSLTVFGFVLMGDCLRDAFDPKLR